MIINSWLCFELLLLLFYFIILPVSFCFCLQLPTVALTNPQWMGAWSTEPNFAQAADFSSFATVVTAQSAQPMPPAGSVPMGFSSGIHHHLFVKVKLNILHNLKWGPKDVFPRSMGKWCQAFGPHSKWWWKKVTEVKNLLSQRNSHFSTCFFVMWQLSRVESLSRQATAASMLTSTLLVARLPTIVTMVTTLTRVFQWQQSVWKMASGVMLPQPPNVYVRFFFKTLI